MSLPLDPEECSWTPEGQEYYRNRYIKTQIYLGLSLIHISEPTRP